MDERDLDLEAKETETANAVDEVLDRGLVPVGNGNVPCNGVEWVDSESGELTI